jgi:4-alpha-glucanotransferase
VVGPTGIEEPHAAVLDGLRLLGKRRFALAIHDACFPGAPGEDIGRGTPYGEGAMGFLAFARSLGFDTIQLGPQGQTARDNPSPYDGTLFSRNILNLDLGGLVAAGGKRGGWGPLLGPETLRRLVEGCPSSDRARSEHVYAYDATHAAMDEIHRNFASGRESKDPDALRLEGELASFTARHQDWLQADALYHALAAEHGWRHYRDWPVTNEGCPDRDLYRHAPDRHRACAARRAELHATHQVAIERYRLGQLILHRQHAALRTAVKRWELRLYGDLQVGISPCDAWGRGALYLSPYRMGAPPSRTNPEGQPWGYGVLDPDQYRDPHGAPGPVLRFLAARVGKMLAEFDGLRIDHPHGLVCPWAYRTDDPNPYHAVRQGARLFSSPHLPDHPDLARYAIARPDQLNAAVPRYADDWVRSLEPGQVDRYALLLDTVVSAVHAHGASSEDVLCEVLSTLPYPLACAVERQGLGRFRVTQKADLDNPADVYRSENARPEDWIMVGNHDTPPIWRLARQWMGDGQARQQAEYLARRLVPEPERAAFARVLAGDRRKLVHAKLADVFASPAAHVMVFFADLLGLEDIYNRPGIPDPNNWTLRVPPDYATRYPQAASRGEALNLPCVLALALRARGDAFARAQRDLIARLEHSAEWCFTAKRS